jgi:cytoskeletal protein RodZ
MRTTNLTGLILTGVLALGATQMQAQVGQDLKNAGHDTADATKTGAHDVAHGTKTATNHTVHRTKIIAHATKRDTVKGADKTADVSKEGYHKTVNGTKTATRKVEGKPVHSSDPNPR